MSEKQVGLLFIELKSLKASIVGVQDAVEALRKRVVGVQDAVEAMREPVARAAAHADAVYVGYQEHGGEIERLRQLVSKLRVACPLLGTGEHHAVCGEEG